MDDKNINFLIKQEEKYLELIKQYNISKNPHTLKEIHSKFDYLCKSWDTIRINLKRKSK